MKKNVLNDAPKSIFYTYKISRIPIFFFLFSFCILNAQNWHANENATVDGGHVWTTDNTSVCLGDENPDIVNVTVEGASGRVKQIIVTDEDENIVALPDSWEVDFSELWPGNYLIWNLSYNGIKPLWHKHVQNLSDLLGRFDLSDDPVAIIVQQKPTGGTLEGGPFEFCVGDGEADHIPEGAITLSGNMGANSQWVVTNEDGTVILGLPPNSYTDVNFDEAPAGTCLVWHLMYEDGLAGLEVGNNPADLMGCFEFSNYVTVIRRHTEGGTLEGGPFEFCVGDGEEDHIPEGAITLSGNEGTNSQWVVTNEDGTVIMGLPPNNYTEVNFDEAPAGICYVWHLSYEDGLTGLEVGNNPADLMGCFSLSNGIEVVRRHTEGGTLDGGSFEFCVGDGEADHIPEGAITLSGNEGTNSQWVVTNEDGTVIMGLPPNNYTEVNFDEAPAGICYVWHLSYEDGLTGLEVGNNPADLMGCFSLSNGVEVVRRHTEGGTLEGGPFEFTVGDGEADNIPEDAITLSGNEGTNSQWVVTNEDGTTILGLPENSYTEVNFDEAPAGTCLVWHLSYEDGLEGLEVDGLIENLSGCFSFSNSVTVVRNESAGRIAIYPNPSKGRVTIDLSQFGSRDVRISVYNLQNIRLFDQQYNRRTMINNKTNLNVSNYLDGIYFVQVIDNRTGNKFIKRLVVNLEN